jgi:antitoxin VapB
MATAGVFKNNRTQSVRLPKNVAFDESVKQVDIVVVGNSRVITPIGLQWAEWFAHGSHITDDFLRERDQPLAQERE